MQTVLPPTWISFLFGLAVTTANANENETEAYNTTVKTFSLSSPVDQDSVTCGNHTGATYESANCDFERNECGWSNTEGNKILWEHTTPLIYGHNDYMRAPMSGASTNSVARLVSPWFRATGNQQCTLQFQYYFRQNGSCQLAVYLDNDTSSMELVWQTSSGPYGPTVTTFREISSIGLPPSNCRHRIIFEARKLTAGHCGYNFQLVILNDEVNIDNIEFHCCSRPLTPTTAAGDRTMTTPSSLSAGVSSTGTTAASPSTTTVSSSHLSSSPESLSAGDEAGSGPMGGTEGTGKGPTIQLIAGGVLSVVVVLVVVLVIVYCRIAYRKGALCCKNRKSRNASSSDATYQSEQNGTGDGTSTDLTHTNPAFVSDDGVTSACYLARDQECLYSVPNKPRHGKKATSKGHPKGDNPAANAGQDYNQLSLKKSRAGPSSSPKQRRAAQPYDHLARGDQHHGDVTEPTPGDRRTGCGTRTLMADVLQSDEYYTLSITTLRASASSGAALPSSARTYDHVPDGERGHQTWPAGDPDPTRASGRAEEVYEHTKWRDFISV